MEKLVLIAWIINTDCFNKSSNYILCMYSENFAIMNWFWCVDKYQNKNNMCQCEKITKNVILQIRSKDL